MIILIIIYIYYIYIYIYKSFTYIYIYLSPFKKVRKGSLYIQNHVCTELSVIGGADSQLSPYRVWEIVGCQRGLDLGVGVGDDVLDGGGWLGR